MAESLLATFATSAGTEAAIASAGATIGPVTAAASGLGTLSTFGSILSPIMTIGSALGQVSSGMQQSAVYKAQAQQYQLAAKQEELKGREQADRIRRSLQANLASQNAIFGARGISTKSGTPVTLARQSMTEAGADIETAMFNAGQGAGALRSQATQSKISANSAKMAGYTGAAGKLYDNRDAFGSLLR